MIPMMIIIIQMQIHHKRVALEERTIISPEDDGIWTAAHHQLRLHMCLYSHEEINLVQYPYFRRHTSHGLIRRCNTNSLCLYLCIYLCNYICPEQIISGIETFLLGRQLITVFIAFLISNITQFHDRFHDCPAILHLLWVRLNLPNLIVTIQLAQLTPEVSNHTKIEILNVTKSNVL